MTLPTNRPELQKMLAYIREGDIILVTELDRLGRNNHDLTKIMNSIQNKGATLDGCKLIPETTFKRAYNE